VRMTDDEFTHVHANFDLRECREFLTKFKNIYLLTQTIGSAHAEYLSGCMYMLVPTSLMIYMCVSPTTRKFNLSYFSKQASSTTVYI
jgi:hypothetical protein